jgi:hypothetical protein
MRQVAPSPRCLLALVVAALTVTLGAVSVPSGKARVALFRLVALAT